MVSDIGTGVGQPFIASLSVASLRRDLLARSNNGKTRATMVKLRRMKVQLIAGLPGHGPAKHKWDWFDIIFSIYFMVMLAAFTATGIALARGDLPTQRIQQLADR
jgi:hypothetical protein